MSEAAIPGRVPADAHPVLNPSTSVEQVESWLAELRDEPLTDDRLLQAIAELETCSEELRVLDEEVRAQQIERAHREGTPLVGAGFAATPLPVLTSDLRGGIRHANSAAVGLLLVPSTRLRGKPLAVFVAEPDRPALRGLVSAAARGHSVGTAALRLVPRGGRPIAVHVAATVVPQASGEPELRWIVLPLPSRGSPPEPALAAAVSDLTLIDPSDDEGTRLEAVAAAVRRALPDVAGVHVLWGDPEDRPAVAGDEAAAEFLAAQLRLHLGPTLDAYARRVPVSLDAATLAGRWPPLVDELRRCGGEAPAVVAVAPMVTSGSAGSRRPVGAVTALFAAPRPDPGEALCLLADVAAAVLSRCAEIRAVLAEAKHLQTALQGRAVIEQAKGMLMATGRCDADEAFAWLVSASQRSNVKLRTLAQHIVTSQALSAPSASGGGGAGHPRPPRAGDRSGVRARPPRPPAR